MPFIESRVHDSARGRTIPETGIIESEWPAHAGSAVASGYRAPSAGSCSVLLAIPSTKWFKPRMLWVDNENSEINRLAFYVGDNDAGTASATIQYLWIGGRDTQFIALDGITIGGSAIYVSALLASCHVRIAGILCESMPEN